MEILSSKNCIEEDSLRDNAITITECREEVQLKFERTLFLRSSFSALGA